MRMGKPIIKRCEVCAGLLEEQTIASCNTIGARNWTDGKPDAPMMPDIPWQVKCPHCRAMLWLDELQEVRIRKRWWGTKTYNIERYHRPVLSDYFKSLAQDNLGDEKIRYLRMRAWWAGNDKRRDSEQMSRLSTQEEANLQALEAFMDLSDVEDRIMAAEIKRELGQFNAALDLLMDVPNKAQSQVVARITELAREQDPFVREVKRKEVVANE